MNEVTLNQAAELLLTHDYFTVLMHRSPDGDAVGSAYGLCMALRSIGKKANPLCGDKIPECYRYMTEQFEIQEFTPEYIVSVDLATEKLLNNTALNYAGKVDLCIDHHASNTHFAKNEYVEGNTASCAEIIKKLLDAMHIKIDKNMANAIFTGVVTDTGCFKYSSVSPDTHRIAADLMECGAESMMICRKMFDSRSRAKLELEKLVLESIEYYLDGKIALIGMTRKMIEQSGVRDDEIEGISAIPRTIEGVEIGITLKEKEDALCRVSLRTCEEVDASKICLQFGGGGHKAAAGCSIQQPFEQAKEAILDAALKAAAEHLL